jgi:Carbohydrate binding domain
MKTLRILLLASFQVCIVHAQSRSGVPSPAPEKNPPFSEKAAESDGRNLLKNPNFEDGTAAWGFFTWGKNGTMQIDPNELHDGKPTLRVENFDACHSFVRQIVQGKPNTRYRITGYIKTKDVEPAKEGQQSGAILMVGRMSVYTPALEGTKSWTKVTADFSTEDDGEIRIGPSLGADATFATGTAWFSELKLIELGAGNLLSNANFHDGTAAWNLYTWGKNARMEIDPNELHDGKPTLRVENLDACHSFIRQIVQGKPNTHYRITGYIKTRDVEPAKDGQPSGAILMVGRIGVYTPLLEGTKSWTKVTAEFTTGDDGEIRIGPSLGADATFATGTAWFSELKLIEIGDAART